MASREPYVPLADLAALFDVDQKTLKRWLASGMPHRMREQRIEVQASKCVQWRRVEDKREQRASESPGEAKERTRKLSADADLAELRLAERRGELVPVAEVEAEMSRLCQAVRARILGARGRWAPRVIGLAGMREATQALDALALDLLKALESGAVDIEAEDAA
jgi:phage terminase Nu1 subunit (DNA packaging protein)